MTRAALSLLVLSLSALPARAGLSEAVKLGGAEAFRAAAAVPTPRVEASSEPVLQAPLSPTAFSPLATVGKQVARVVLAAQLDKQRALIARQLGAKPWDIGVATDASMKAYYLTFTPAAQAAPVALAPVGELKRLTDDAGVNARVDAGTVYNFKVSINLFSPVRGSTLHVKPAPGTSGPGHDVKTGVLLDAVKARSAVFKASGKEYWLQYGTDVDAKGTGFADTRSFLFIHENGTSSKAWPLAESSLRPGVAGVVDLGGTKLSLVRTAGGELLVSEVR